MNERDEELAALRARVEALETMVVHMALVHIAVPSTTEPHGRIVAGTLGQKVEAHFVALANASPHANQLVLAIQAERELAKGKEPP